MATFQIVLDERHFCNVNFPEASLEMFCGFPRGNRLFIDPITGKIWLRIIVDNEPYFVMQKERYHDICWGYFPDFDRPLPNIIWQLITLFIINTERYRNGRPIIE